MIIALDLETTGLDSEKDKIIEIAIIKFDETTFETIDTYGTLVNPEIEIPKIISNITSIYDKDCENSPKIYEIINEIENFIGDLPILGHNTFFDRSFLIKNGIKIQKNIILDTFFISNFLCFKEKSQNLGMLSNSLGVKIQGFHRALEDTKATIKIFEKLFIKIKKLDSSKLDLLFFIFSSSLDENIIFLKNILFGERKKIKADKFKKEILEKIGKEDSTDSIITDGNKKIEDIKTIINGIKGLETRENQINMSEIICDTIQNSQKTVIEAPTGLGKSFAYLIPSIVHSIKLGEKFFISTKTKTLQDQLFYKDLEFLKNSLDKFNYSKLKGKNNYLSVYRLFEFLEVDNLDYEKVSFLSKIILWLSETEYGELEELNYYGKEKSYLRFLNGDDISTTKEKNPYKLYEFVLKARNKVYSSNIIIINHSLLFSDLISDSLILGNIDNLIIDEAHAIEDVLTESLKNKFDKKYLEEFFSYIENIFSKKGFKKMEFLDKKQNLIDNIDMILDLCNSYISHKIPDINLSIRTTLILDDFFETTNFSEILKKIKNLFLDLIDNLSILDFDFSREKKILENYLNILSIVLNKNSKEKYISIISANNKGDVFIEYTYLNPGDYLEKNLRNKLNVCILTSASLKIGDSFSYLSKSLSLENEFDFHSFETEFDYKKQSTLFIPNNLGSIKNNSSNIISFLREFFLIVKGNTIVLFTSFNSIKNVYVSINTDLKNIGVNLYAQGIGGGKNKLLESFKQKSDNSILMGTDSFWEGIDLPGDDLKYLIIHKIPFMVPTDPIFQARSKLFNNPFLDYSLPKAVLKLKQGFGRLIRTNTDSGIVVFLDDRIYSTDWGQEFYKAFPKGINTKLGISDSFLKVIENRVSYSCIRKKD